MLFQRLEVQRVLPKDLDLHLLLLNLDQHVQLAKDGLDGLVSALVVLQELLHVPEGMAKSRLMNQR